MMLTIKLRRGPLWAGDIPSSASEDTSDNAVELMAAVAFKRRGVETKLVLPGLAQQNHGSRCDAALIKAIARGRAWFEELATGRARALQGLAKRDGINRRYIRRLVDLAFLSPQLVETILQGRQPVELTATRLTELDLGPSSTGCSQANRKSGDLPRPRPPRPGRCCKQSELSRGGTASMPFGEKRPRSVGLRAARPFSRPQPHADPRTSAGLFADSPGVHC
jgi:hypothetical protein